MAAQKDGELLPRATSRGPAASGAEGDPPVPVAEGAADEAEVAEEALRRRAPPRDSAAARTPPGTQLGPEGREEMAAGEGKGSPRRQLRPPAVRGADSKVHWLARPHRPAWIFLRHRRKK